MLFVKIGLKLVDVLQLYRTQCFKLEYKRCQQAVRGYWPGSYYFFLLRLMEEV